MAFGVLNLAMGLLIVFVCFRLSALNKAISEVEKRISRVEILTSLADSKESLSKESLSMEEQATKRRAGGML